MYAVIILWLLSVVLHIAQLCKNSTLWDCGLEKILKGEKTQSLPISTSEVAILDIFLATL